MYFGDIFRYHEEEFVYLTAINGHIYAAKILSIAEKRAIENLLEIRIRGERKGNLEQNFLYHYVPLKTALFLGRAAHLISTKNMVFDGYGSVVNLDIKLENEDLDALKKEIVASEFVPTDLRETIQALKL